MVQFTKLRLSGFKSFVDPTEILIESGVTGVVGPNGCGKSNLVEALRWVMGENSAKRMRGSEMDDVIFAGSATRPSRNIADVTLFLDNSTRNAPAMFNDFDELEVVRRINRGSGSTYRVNGKEVRARDVQLLFADAASGAHSTAMVSQGRVGALINAKPTDRRALLEEAAGITGLHSRRHEAELRLRAAETNLERLDDVIATLEAQLQNLRKQARQATRYRNINDQIRRLEAIGLYQESTACKESLESAGAQLRAAEFTVAGLTESTAAAAREQAEAAAQLPELRQAEAEAAAALQRLLVDRDNLQREEAQAAATKAQATQRLQQIESDRLRAESLNQDARSAQQRLEEERETLATQAEGEAETQRQADAERLATAEVVATREAELAGLTEKVAADEARAGALTRRVEELVRRAERLGARAGDLRRQNENLLLERAGDSDIAAAETVLAAAETELADNRATAETAGTALTAARESESEARGKLQEAEAAHAKLEAEAAALTAILKPSEPDMWPAVVDAVEVEAGFEAALGAALGDDLTAPADEAAPVHWETLPAYTQASTLPQGTEPLSDKVKGPAALARRLSQIGVVADDTTGKRLQRELARGQRLVTRQGALWRWDGLSAKADAPTAAAVRLAQRNRLSQLVGLLATTANRVAAAAAEHTRLRHAAETAAMEEKAARETMSGSFEAVNSARRRHAELAQKSAALASRLTAVEENRERLQAELAEVEGELTTARGESAELPPLDALRKDVVEKRTQLAEHRADLVSLQSKADRLLREAEARRERLLSIQTEMASWAKRGEEADRHLTELDTRGSETKAEIDRLAAIPLMLTERRDTLAELLETAENRRRQAADQLALGETRQGEADRALKAEEVRTASAREDRVRAEAAVEQGRQALANVVEKVRERLGCHIDRVLEMAEIDPDRGLPSHEEVETKLARLNRERDNMGPVNLRAETEARELDEQITGMQTERSDLIAAIARLRQGISSLNREGRERLLAAFSQVDAHFSELFVRLFGGGRAHLKLTEADDPLEAGLEIMASPPGKRLQVMSLLSGGEQALTALSLLFAVFLTNPAPICVLDEVDAPLDDSNVDRFCTLVDELRRTTSTRFLVITHHRMTMARVDRLFGVTMGERGVSQLVSVDLDDAEELRESA